MLNIYIYLANTGDEKNYLLHKDKQPTSIYSLCLC